MAGLGFRGFGDLTFLLMHEGKTGVQGHDQVSYSEPSRQE